jgi:hypothetical protein
MTESNGQLVYFRGGPWDGRAETMPDGRDNWMVPHTAEYRGAFYFGTSLGAIPQPALYRRTSPPEYENVLTRDLIVKKGTRLVDFTMAYDAALVFECVSEGGR